MKILSLLLTVTSALAADMPSWILPGIANTESSSYFHQNTLVYVDKRRGSRGERGPFQVQKIAFDQVSIPGEQFRHLETDMYFAQDITTRYLFWLYQGPARRSWRRAVCMYNSGPSWKGDVDDNQYLRKVQENGRGRVAAGWGG